MSRKSLRTIALLCLPSLLALAACNADGFLPGEEQRAIINGTATSEWPAAGALAYDYQGQWGFFCSATLIAPQWVLTAAHCADASETGIQPSMASFFVGANATNPNNGQVFQIDAVYLHPQWDPDTVANDIALYHLSSPATGVTPIPNNTSTINSGLTITWVGYGVNVADGSGGGTGDGIKRKATGSINAGLWSDAYAYTANAQDQLTCFGDSGGPDLATISGQTVVVGVHSTVSSSWCNGEGYSTRVDNFQTFITNTINGGGPTSCDMTGGDCGTQACWFTADNGVFSCISSDNLSDYATCDPESTSANLQCQDGAGCFDWTEGGRCYEFCNTAADCAGGRGCANGLFGDAAPTLGLCTTDCNIAGGTCGAGKACYPVDTDVNGCFGSDGLQLGVACDPTPAADANLPCADGLICLQTGVNENVGQCFELCATSSDCGTGNQCNLFEGYPEVGYCSCIDADNDNYCQADDCDDNSASVHPGAMEVCGDGIDQDCSGADTACVCDTDADHDGYISTACPGGDDCNDLNAATHPDAAESCADSADNDCDGVVNEGCGTCTDVDGDGYCNDVDCNDNNAAVHPGAAESCADQIDNNCSGQVNEGCGTCLDRDQDGYPDAACGGGDCNDYDFWVNPGRPEVCDDGIDNDCSGQADDGCGCDDADQDGYEAATCGGNDCNDLDYWVNPGAAENCSDQVDNNCDGQVNEGCGTCTDRDQDGWCITEGDCNDNNAAVNPGQAEACGDALDNNCDGQVNEGCGTCTDADQDGWCITEGDCNDGDATIFPGAAEACNDVLDNNCDGQVNEGCTTCTDHDLDGYCSDVDCDDLDYFTKPFTDEMCGDSKDNDCDGEVDEGCGTCTDADGDGSCAGADCNDGNAAVHPGAAEACNDSLDNDCDGQVDEGCGACDDLDGDGYCAGDDCNDLDPGVHPGAAEVCGDLTDNDCDLMVDETCSQPCQSAAQCEDLNPCTVDTCGADLNCAHAVLPDFTPCGLNNGGVCISGQCRRLPDDGDGCQTGRGGDPLASGFGLLFLALTLGLIRRLR